jgi:hypothetical protein
MTPHVLPNSALALRNSSSLRTRLGTAASIAGLTNALRALIKPWNTNSGHTRLPTAVSRPQAASAWAPDTIISRRRRSNRSTTGPAIGEAKKAGRENDT